MATPGVVKNVTKSELDDVLGRATAEKVEQLVIVGQGIDVRFLSEEGLWQLAFNGSKVYQLCEQFGSLAKRVVQLTQLKKLMLFGVGLDPVGARAIAEHLGQLTTLGIRSNEIGEAGARAIAERLGQLVNLVISDNWLNNAAVTALASGLKSLRMLDVRDNKQIDDIAPLSRLPALYHLQLSGTFVSDLSSFAARILAGLPLSSDRYGIAEGIHVFDLPLKHPSQEIVAQGPEAVKNYFREIAEQGVDRLYEAKVLILGEGGAGKTSLLRRLYQPTMPLPRVDETTRGIDVHRQDFQTADGRTFRLNVWDFGGQQIYHATHQFFLTTSSLYVLVDDTKKDHKSVHDEGFKFWLEVVETLSDKSPLLIFQNEKGGRSKAIDEAGIKGRFPNFKEKYRGDLDQPHSADTIRQAIQYSVQQLPHVGKAVPAKWVTIRKAIEEEAERKPYISQDEYFAIYRRHLEFDRTKALYLSQTLHNLGVFLHFQDDPLLRKTVILQNQWATDAVFRMLDDEVVKQAKGHFTLKDCRRVWAAPQYEDMDQEMLGLMEKFELCYRLTDSTEPAWLAPRLLPPSKPVELGSWASPSDLVVRFRYTFLPRGLVSRLIVRQHRFIKQVELSWEHGAFFEKNETQVLAEEIAQGNTIELRARAPENKALLSVLASGLEELNDTFKGLQGKVEKLVPCICDQCCRSMSPEMYEQAELVRRKKTGKLTIECRPSYANVSVVELLDGLRPEHIPDWAMAVERASMSEEGYVEPPRIVSREPREKTIRIFLASSSELKDDRDAFDLYFRQQNDRLRKEGFYLEIIRWENFLDGMSETRLQDDYNKKVRACNIFVSLFMTKTGKFTEEEFDVAHQTFKKTGKPLIYTYFKETNISSSGVNRDDMKSLWAFQEKLTKLGHYQTQYNGVEHLKRHFMDQLNKLRDEGLL